ncbi:hypothetical protein K0B96_16745 [Horticoccus luteus]|uniref:Uncharacterized protein n=1 Tax=Horticoccus luteus TaxID=2862869 RepID=A0A8F9TTU9_9BACT|nr:hypothetical protein [Horticoccus luteus]QYM78930.1 hypothetical protein K0B96_16745 [Horticoccus luteus]
MNATPAVLRYLAHELTTRWRAQPISPFARWLLTLVLTAAAGVFLAGFAAAEMARRAQLQHLGLDTLVVRVPARSALGEAAPWPADSWAAPLSHEGELTWLQQLPQPAFNPWDRPLPAFAAALPTLAALLPAEAPAGRAVWFTRSLPAGRDVRLTFHNVPLVARTVQPAARWQALGLDEFVLLPPPAGDVTGRLDVMLFTPDAGHSLADTAALVAGFFTAENEPPPAVQDPSPYRRALDELVARQVQWRRGMLVALAGCIAAMFGCIGLLEERQTRYAQALLRSLGVGRGLLWASAWVENLLLANTALLCGIWLSGTLAARLLAGVNVISPDVMPLAPAQWLWLAIGVNTGVLASIFPLGRALRRPVGQVLP